VRGGDVRQFKKTRSPVLGRKSRKPRIGWLAEKSVKALLLLSGSGARHGKKFLYMGSIRRKKKGAVGPITSGRGTHKRTKVGEEKIVGTQSINRHDEFLAGARETKRATGFVEERGEKEND